MILLTFPEAYGDNNFVGLVTLTDDFREDKNRRKTSKFEKKKTKWTRDSRFRIIRFLKNTALLSD